MGLTENCAMSASSGLYLSSNLLDLDNYKFSRFKRGKTDQDIDNTAVDVILSGGFLVTIRQGLGKRTHQIDDVTLFQIIV